MTSQSPDSPHSHPVWPHTADDLSYIKTGPELHKKMQAILRTHLQHNAHCSIFIGPTLYKHMYCIELFCYAYFVSQILKHIACHLCNIVHIAYIVYGQDKETFLCILLQSMCILQKIVTMLSINKYVKAFDLKIIC